jgi:dihydroorotate dehydrogenase (NAD+) catalytic subunit
LGAVVTKALTPEARAGNPTPRVTETASGMLNAIGLQNSGLCASLEGDLPWLIEQQVPIIVNVAGKTVTDYQQVAEALGSSGVSALELNLSCPNVAQGGMSFGTDPATIRHVILAVKEVCDLPLVVKLTPNITDITLAARAAEEAGAAALTVINTLRGMAIDIQRRKPVLGNVFGGLSGAAIKPVALACVWQVAEAVEIPVIGCGGISSLEDVLEFILAGASAVQVGSATFNDPFLLPRLMKELAGWLEAEDTTVTALVGKARGKDND